MDSTPAPVQRALLQFMLHMAAGETEAALAAMRQVKVPGVWSTMAQVAVKSRQVPVLKVCLANMESLALSQAVRAAMAQPAGSQAIAPLASDADDAVQGGGHGAALPHKHAVLLGTAAAHLNMPDEAAEIFAAGAAWPQLCSLRRAQGRWADAIATAQQHSRLQLRAVHAACAHDLERRGKFGEAIPHFEAAGVAAHEVTRMLLQAGNIEALEAYVENKKENDKELSRWWGMYLASQGRSGEAQAVFAASGDAVSQVRS